MSEKRFWKMQTFQGFCDIFDNEKTICSVRIEYADTLLNLLNSLSEENEQLMEQIQILKKEVRDFLHLCDVCDIQSHLSDECEEVLNDE